MLMITQFFKRRAYLLDSDDSSTVKAERVYKLNKTQYIGHLYNIVSAPLQCAFTARIMSFDFNQNNGIYRQLLALQLKKLQL